MDAEKYNRSISLQCPTCGSTQFASSDDESSEIVTCASCGRELTRDELLRENSENISEHVKEIESQVVKDVEKELKDTLTKAFEGNKYIQIK